MIEIALLAVLVLVVLLTLGVPLPYCFGAGLMVMYFAGDVVMKGNMLWGRKRGVGCISGLRAVSLSL